MKKIKVLHITGTMNRGGQETFIMNLYRNINRDRIIFDFIVHGEKKGDYEREIEELGGKIHRVTPKGKNIFKYMIDMFKIFKESKYDIVHIHTCSTTVFLDAAIVRFFKMKNIVIHSHNTSVVNNFSMHRLGRPILNSLTTNRLGCSKEAIEWLFGSYREAIDIIVRNSIDTKKYIFNKDIRKKIRKQLDIENKLVIGHIGRFEEQKNHEFLIRIFDGLIKNGQDAILLLIGRGEGEAGCRRLVEKLGLQEKVKFLGVRSDIEELLQGIDILVFPSKYEGLPLTLIEAQAAGVPIVISKHLSQDIDITELVKRVGLDEGIQKWVDEITGICEKQVRDNTYSKIRQAGYDITDNVKWIETYYSKIINSR